MSISKYFIYNMEIGKFMERNQQSTVLQGIFF